MFGCLVLVGLMAGAEGAPRRSFLQERRICRQATEEQATTELRKVAAGFYDGSSVCYLTGLGSEYPHLTSPDTDAPACHGRKLKGGKRRARSSTDLRFEVNQKVVAANKHIFVRAHEEEPIACHGPELSITVDFVNDATADEKDTEDEAPAPMPRRLEQSHGLRERPSIEISLSSQHADDGDLTIDFVCKAPLKIPDSAEVSTPDVCAAEALQCQGEYWFQSPDGCASRKRVQMQCRSEDWAPSAWGDDLPTCLDLRRRLLVV